MITFLGVCLGSSLLLAAAAETAISKVISSSVISFVCFFIYWSWRHYTIFAADLPRGSEYLQ